MTMTLPSRAVEGVTPDEAAVELERVHRGMMKQIFTRLNKSLRCTPVPREKGEVVVEEGEAVEGDSTSGRIQTLNHRPRR